MLGVHDISEVVLTSRKRYPALRKRNLIWWMTAAHPKLLKTPDVKYEYAGIGSFYYGFGNLRSAGICARSISGDKVSVSGKKYRLFSCYQDG